MPQTEYTNDTTGIPVIVKAMLKHAPAGLIPLTVMIEGLGMATTSTGATRVTDDVNMIRKRGLIKMVMYLEGGFAYEGAMGAFRGSQRYAMITHSDIWLSIARIPNYSMIYARTLSRTISRNQIIPN